MLAYIAWGNCNCPKCGCAINDIPFEVDTVICGACGEELTVKLVAVDSEISFELMPTLG